MKIVKNHGATAKGSADWFIGDVDVDSIAVDGSGINAAVVHFTPGGRTAWHQHDHGHTIYITEGTGRVALARSNCRSLHGPHRHAYPLVATAPTEEST